TRESKKEYKSAYKLLKTKEIEVPEPLNFNEFGTIHGGRTLQDLDEFCRVSFSMDGGELVDVPWHVAKFLCDKAKGAKKKSKFVGAHLIGRITMHLGLMSPIALGIVTRGQETQLLNLAKLGELGEIDDHIYKLGGEMEELTEVVSSMSEQYDEFYGDFRSMRLEQDRFQSWNMSYMSQLLSYHHLNHTRFDGSQYTYVPEILDLGVQQGVNFMSNPQTYSTAPSDPAANQFGLFGDAPSTFHHHGNDMDEE
ncbi:hypothetical protein Tco_1462947, partial [Tanacetum coccineum]